MDAGAVCVIAPSGFLEHAVSENLFAGPAMGTTYHVTVSGADSITGLPHQGYLVRHLRHHSQVVGDEQHGHLLAAL